MTPIIDEFTQALLSMDRVGAQRLIARETRKTGPIQFIEDVVVVALETIGEQWQKGEIALSQVYMGGRICEELVDQVLPPEDPQRTDQPKMAICVLSDHHGLGKTIVYSVLRATGFELLDLGTMEVDDLIHQVEKEGIEILLVSVLMLPSALKVKTLKQKLDAKKMDVKILVGGAPFRFDRALWKEVGADAMCTTASDAVSTIELLMGGVK